MHGHVNVKLVCTCCSFTYLLFGLGSRCASYSCGSYVAFTVPSWSVSCTMVGGFAVGSVHRMCGV